MARIDEIKEEIKQLNGTAINLQNELHDLAEGLPRNLDQLLETARKTFEAFTALAEKKEELKSLKSS